jgi:hypothetical protein
MMMTMATAAAAPTPLPPDAGAMTVGKLDYRPLFQKPTGFFNILLVLVAVRGAAWRLGRKRQKDRLLQMNFRWYCL